MSRYDDPDVIEFIEAAARHCHPRFNMGEVVSILHALGYSLPQPAWNETDRLQGAVREYQARRGRPPDFPCRWSAVLEVAWSLGYKKA